MPHARYRDLNGLRDDPFGASLFAYENYLNPDSLNASTQPSPVAHIYFKLPYLRRLHHLDTSFILEYTSLVTTHPATPSLCSLLLLSVDHIGVTYYPSIPSSHTINDEHFVSFTALPIIYKCYHASGLRSRLLELVRRLNFCDCTTPPLGLP